MAKIVISELLCFIRHNFDKLTVSQLKPVVCNFYKDDDICEATDILLKDIHALVSSDTVPRMPNRQGPSNVNNLLMMCLSSLRSQMNRNYGIHFHVMLLKI